MSWQRPLATLDLRGIDADFHSHSQKQDNRWLDKINIKTYIGLYSSKRRDEAATFFSVAVCLQSSAPAFNRSISVNCHNFSESKVKVEIGGQKLKLRVPDHE